MGYTSVWTCETVAHLYAKGKIRRVLMVNPQFLSAEERLEQLSGSNRRGAAQTKLYRRLAILYLGGKCNRCGKKEELEIDHKDGDWQNEDLSNIWLLCKDCHHTKKRWFKVAVVRDTA